MKYNKSEFTYYSSESSQADFRTRQALSSKAIDVATNQQIFEKQILVALGFIATLLFISGMQLFRSVNVKTSGETTTPRRTPTFNLEDADSIAPSVELDSFAHSQKNEMLTIQNAISHGKF